MKLFESLFKTSHLWLRPSTTWPRLLATVGGVAIGVAAFVSTILASRAAVAFLDEDVGQISGRAVLEVRRAGGVPLESLGKLRELSSEVLLTPIVEEACLLPQLGDLVRVLGVDLLSDLGLRTSGSLAGDGEEARRATEAMLQGNGAAISSALAEELDLEVGEAFEVLVRSKLRTVEVASIFEPPRSASAWARIVLVDIALAQELTSSLDSVTRIEMIPRDAETQVFSVDDVRALEERALALLPEGHQVGPTADRRDEGGRMVQALEFNLTALSGVSILVGTVLVATALGTSVVQRRRAIALMRSLGASSRQLCITVLAEAGVIGFLGGVVGVILGWLGAKASLAGVRATTATVVEGSIAGEVELSTGAALLGLGIGVLSSLAAAFLPMREA
ncbi:MAG: ABC transporter permease, partial [Planctomycetota bacterium]